MGEVVPTGQVVTIPFIHSLSPVTSHRRFRLSSPQIRYHIRRESCVGGSFWCERGNRLLADTRGYVLQQRRFNSDCRRLNRRVISLQIRRRRW